MLKDWEKVVNGEYLNKTNYNRIVVDKLYYSKRGSWAVELYSRKGNRVLKRTKTKSKALKFARAYMRKH